MKRAQRGISRAIPFMPIKQGINSEPKSSFGDSLTVRTNGYEDAQIETRIAESIKRSIARQVLAELVKPQQNTTT